MAVMSQTCHKSCPLTKKRMQVLTQKMQPPPPHGKGRPPHKPDNMRGFDPASEDDMEDNGMSRYMENNDEEGWN